MIARNRNAVQHAGLADSFDTLRNDYQAAKSSRFRRRRTGVSPMGSGADYHYRSEADYLRIMEQARDMDRNDVVVGQTIDRACINTVQDGFTNDPQTGDKKIDQDLWARFSNWAGDPEQCDIAGEMCFSDMEQLVPRHTIVDGDIIGLPMIEGCLQLVEAHRLRTPNGTKRNVVHGVLMDDVRRRMQYWITKEDISPLASVGKVSDIQPIDARDKNGHRQVFHVYNPKRVSQTRGVSALAPIFDVCGMFEDIQFAKLVQQQIVSCFAIFRERSLEFQANTDSQYGERTTESLPDGSVRTIEGISPGMELTGAVGEKLKGFSPSVPSNEFFQHVKLILTLIGINLGLPLIEVLMDGSETNFSGWRGAVDEARKGFRRNQQSLIKKFHSPVYRWKVRQWLAEDKALARAAGRKKIDIFGHRWNPPRWPYIEPNKDASADAMRREKLLVSPRRNAAENGYDHEELMDETIADNYETAKKAIVAAQKLTQETSVAVDWREMLWLGAKLAPVPSPEAIGLAETQAASKEKSHAGN